MRALLFIPLLLLATAAVAEEPALRGGQTEPQFDTSYTPSAAVSYRVKRQFLDDVYRSAGPDIRASFQQQFDTEPPQETWAALVAPLGFAPGTVADALAAYWLLNWTVANAAYTVEVDGTPVRKQLLFALATDGSFAGLDDDRRQAMAERLMLDYLVMHTTMTSALRTGNTEALQKLARQAVLTFRQQYGVDLLALEPGPDGLAPRVAEASPARD